MTICPESSQQVPHKKSLSEEVDFARTFPELIAASIGCDTLPTNKAAAAINRSPQTLRKWACLGTGPIRPIKIYGRLAWHVCDLRALLSGEAK